MNKQILRGIILAGLFIVPFVPFFVSSSLFFPFITTKAFAWRAIVEIIFGVWIVLALIAPEFRLRRSPILYAVLAFILIIGVADAFGAAPLKSFWSNFERMEGFITLLHLAALFVVTSSVFKEREWRWWWNTSLVASALMVVYCLFQLAGVADIHQGGARVDGSLGNAAYLALYLLVHIFVALVYLLKSKNSTLRWSYWALIAAEIIILYFTATRGAILALMGGLGVIALLNLGNRDNMRARKWSMYLLAAIAILTAGFVLVRNTSFVKNNAVLDRLSTISLSEWKNEGRSYVWPMAIQGIKEKPILGWGQDNFNYVFAEHYSAHMFRLEPWFDRAHNIFLDWAVAGGILGLGAYLALYIVLLIAIWRRDASLTRLERSVLTGLIAAYFFNNLFVFDNLVSYIFFFALLAQVHGRTFSPAAKAPVAPSEGKTGLIAILVGIATLFTLYFADVKPIVANTSLIGALQNAQGGDKTVAMSDLEKAYNESRLGRPEVVEWISSSAASFLGDEKIPMGVRNDYFDFAKGAIEGMTISLPNDPRYEIVAGSFYSSIGLYDDALRHFRIAEKLMPEKQLVRFSLGQTLLQKGDAAGALAEFKSAYEADTEYEEAKTIYLLGAIYTKDAALEDSLIAQIPPEEFLKDNRILSALYQTGQTARLTSLLRDLEQKLPQYSAQIEASLKQIQK